MMDVMTQLVDHRVRLVPKRDSWLMAAVGALLGEAFVRRFWTTIRFPFCRPVIYYPTSVLYPEAFEHRAVLAHELTHVRQFATWGGPIWMALLYLLLPLPAGLSGRWFVERHAYLGDIRAGVQTVDSAVATLHHAYLRPWPREWMRQWFLDRLDA